MFSCCGRGRRWYKTRIGSVESSIFRQLFPDVPLFGFFGEGEVGLNFVPDTAATNSENGERNEQNANEVKEPSHKAKRKNPERLIHQFTTIFVMISIS